MPAAGDALGPYTLVRSLGIGVTTRYASLLLRTRSLPVGESSALGWQASLRWPF